MEVHHQHTPKPWHGWREFLREYVIVVVGVMTAAAVGLALEGLRRHIEVTEAREALRSEIAEVGRSALYGIDEERCFSDLWDEAILWANGGPPLQQRIIRGGLPPYPTTTWDVVKVGALAHMPLAERLAYSRLYGLIENQKAVREIERPILFRMAGYLGGAAINGDPRSLMADARQLKLVGRIRAENGVDILAAIKGLGVEPAARTASQRDDLAGLCRPLPSSSAAPKP